MARQRLYELVTFGQAERGLDETVDEVAALHLFARRNEVPEAAARHLSRARDLGFRLLAVLHQSAAGVRAVQYNFKAMIYATLDHALIRVLLASKHWDLVTVVSTGTSFVLDRMAEYSYVQSAQAQESAGLRQCYLELCREMWETVADNPQTAGLSWEACQKYRHLISRLRASLEGCRSAEPAVRLYTMLFYVRLIFALESLGPVPVS